MRVVATQLAPLLVCVAVAALVFKRALRKLLFGRGLPAEAWAAADVKWSRATSACLVCIGTRGDVEPCIALGRELMRRKLKVVIVCADVYGERVAAAGLAFESCGLDEITQRDWSTANTLSEFIRVLTKPYLHKYDAIGLKILEIFKTHRVDVCLSGLFGMHICKDVCDITGVALYGCKLVPDLYSAVAPPFNSDNRIILLNYGYMHLRRSVTAVIAAIASGVTTKQNQFRASLGLGPTPLSRLGDVGFYLPTVYGYSEIFYKTPSDWPFWHKPTGFWRNERRGGEIPRVPANSVVVTFGSMEHIPLDFMSNLLYACSTTPALSICEHIVVFGGASTPNPSPVSTRYVHKKTPTIVRIIPHANTNQKRLFEHPNVLLIFHHGGAGTTIDCVMARKPCVVVPVLKFYDQLGWGQALAKSKLGGVLRSGLESSAAQISDAAGAALESFDVESKIPDACARDATSDAADFIQFGFLRDLKAAQSRYDSRTLRRLLQLS